MILLLLSLCLNWGSSTSGVEIYNFLATKGVPSLGSYNLQFQRTYVNKDPHLTKGYNYLTDFDYQDALKEFNLSLKNNPNNRGLRSEAYCYIGYCYLNLRNSAEAVSALKKSIEMDPGNELAHFFLANEYFLQGRMDDVKYHLIEAINIHEKFIAALRMLAETYKDEGDGLRAITYYTKLVEILPNSGYYRFQLYRAYASYGQFKEAEKELKELMRIEPNYFLNYDRLGEIYLEQKKYESALEAYSKLLQSDKLAYMGHIGRAEVYMDMQNLRAAREELKNANKLKPNNKEVKDVQYKIERIEYERRRKALQSAIVVTLIILLIGLLSFFIYSTHRRNYILSIISKFNESLDQIYDIGELAIFLLEFFCKILAIRSGFLLLYNRQNNTLSVMISRGLEDKEHDAFQIVTGNEVTNWIMTESRPILTIKELERSRYFEEAFPSLLVRLKKKLMTLVIPLKEKNSCLGFIVLGDGQHHDAKRYLHYDLLMPLSTIAAQSMQTLFLFESSIVDELTGLYNKRYFYQSLTLELKRADRYRQPCSLCTFDLDDFKKCNDTFGHTHGDIVLQELGRIVLNNIREGIDISCRTGGEEFNLILPATNKDLAFTVAERIRLAVADHQFPGIDKPIRMTLSTGIATYPDHAQNESELIRICDKALYHAKRNGKNRVSKADQVELGEGEQKFRSEPLLESRFDDLNIMEENTGLYNFTYFSLRIKEEIKRADRYSFPCALVVLRSNLSMAESDAASVVQQMSCIIKSNLREGIDTPAVISEDLIGIIVPETSREKVYTLAKRLKEKIDGQELEMEGRKITVSLGISAYPESSNSVNELMESATSALKKAQKIGEGKIFISPPLQADQ